MPDNGAGVFSLTYNWENDANNSINIRADRMDVQEQDIADSLTNRICKDGQTTATADLPMGGFKHINCANAINLNEYATLGQLQTTVTASGNYYNTTVAVSGAAQALDLATFQSYFITLTAACTITFSALPTSGPNLNERIIILLQNGTGGWSVTWPASILWTGTTSPTTPPTLGTSLNTYSAIRLKTKDSGVTWVGSVEGSGGQGSGYTPVAGNYLAVGNTSKANKSSDALTFTAANPTISGSPNLGFVKNNGTNFILGVAAGSGAPADITRYTTDGTTYGTPTGAIIVSQLNNIIVFSNGNIMLSGQPNTGNLNLSTDNGVTYNVTTMGDIASGVTIFGISGNTALVVSPTSAKFTTTTDGATFATSQTHTGMTANANTCAILNNFCFVGGTAGQIGYKTIANLTAVALTAPTSNLDAFPVLGFVSTNTTWIAYTGTAISTAVVGTPGTWTSRTTAFFTTAAISGTIVKMLFNGVRLLAVTSTGDIGYSDDGATSWTKLSAINNPLSGFAINGIEYVNSAFWVFGDQGKLAASTLGAAFTAVTTAFASTSIKAFAGN